MSRDEKTRGTSRPSLPRRLSFARRGFTSFELVLTLTLIGLVLALGVFRGHLDVLAAVQEKTDQCSGPAPREMWWSTTVSRVGRKAATAKSSTPVR